MQLPIPVRAPFDLAQSLAFLRRFPPCRYDVVIADDRVTAALAVGGRAVRFSVLATGGGVAIDVDDDLAPATSTSRPASFASADLAYRQS